VNPLLAVALAHTFAPVAGLPPVECLPACRVDPLVHPSFHSRRIRLRGHLRRRAVPKEYTVLAVGATGEVSSVRTSDEFDLAAPHGTATLHLRGPDGSYAGPIVVGGNAKRVTLGVREGANLGTVRIHDGFAQTERDLPARFADPRVQAVARRGRPVGGRNFGLVRSRRASRAGRGRDADSDGVVGAFDVDDDGDLELDNVDRAAGSAGVGDRRDPFGVASVLPVGLIQSYLAERLGFAEGLAGYALNQNTRAPDRSLNTIRDLALRIRAVLLFRIPPGDEVELDCAGLTYCSPGSTGATVEGGPRLQDTDGDGFYTMVPVGTFLPHRDGFGTTQTVDPTRTFAIQPHTAASLIGSGDTYIEHVKDGETEHQHALTLRYIFGTVPALAGWSDGTRTEPINYPVPENAPERGSGGGPITLRRSGRSYVLRLTLWRPQRESIPGSSDRGEWMDIGGLTYTVVGATNDASLRLWRCRPSAYSRPSSEVEVRSNGVLDTSADRPARPANKFTFDVNLSECLRDSALPEWGPGQPGVLVYVDATTPFGDSAEGVGFAFRPG
jgi:hypothetical protein